jgi:RNA polymerase sigma-70 factor (ECF subfamily)
VFAEPATRGPVEYCIGEAESVEAAREGDADAFERLYECYSPGVYAFAASRLRDRIEAEDVTQEVFLAALHSFDAYAGRGRFRSWLFGITRNVIRERFRRQSRRAAQEVNAAEPAPAPSTPEDELRLSKLTTAIRAELERLESWQAKAVELVCLDEIPEREVARRMERSRHAVRMSVERVRRRVAERAG